MTSYLQKLQVEATHRKPSAVQKQCSDEQLYVPLVQQIDRLSNSLSPAELLRPWHIDDWIARLDGKYHSRPHGRWVGLALRQLGWSHVRLWGAEWRGRRMWLPPKFNF